MNHLAENLKVLKQCLQLEEVTCHRSLALTAPTTQKRFGSDREESEVIKTC
ncbi:hypothetical protein J6590_063093 [Homalodisca vitripennis]|nr:hypothetical protein J6590_063093 [Homalodisca vitripennis]